jgi:hypothetical protein
MATTIKGPSNDELFGDFADADVDAVRRLARSHTRDALGTLVKLMKAPKTPAGVKRACATDILNQGWGRPDARADDSAPTGITVNILKLSTGVTEQIISPGANSAEIAEAVATAKTIALPAGKVDV